MTLSEFIESDQCRGNYMIHEVRGVKECYVDRLRYPITITSKPVTEETYVGDKMELIDGNFYKILSSPVTLGDYFDTDSLKYIRDLPVIYCGPRKSYKKPFIGFRKKEICTDNTDVIMLLGEPELIILTHLDYLLKMTHRERGQAFETWTNPDGITREYRIKAIHYLDVLTPRMQYIYDDELRMFRREFKI